MSLQTSGRHTATERHNSRHFIEPKSSSPFSQQPANRPYPEPDQSSQRTPNLFNIHFNIIPHLLLCLPSGSLSLRFPHKNPACTSPLCHTCHMPCSSKYSSFNHLDTIRSDAQATSSSLCRVLHRPVTSSLSGPHILRRILHVLTPCSSLKQSHPTTPHV